MDPHAPIAIVGMGCVLPGANSPDEFWRILQEGRDQTRPVPRGRWIIDPESALASGPDADRVYSTNGCFVDGFSFDPSGLAISSEELRGLDPVYHMALHAGRQAFADGVTSSLNRSRVGVVLAAIALPTEESSAVTREVLGRALFEKLRAAAPADAAGRLAWREPAHDVRNACVTSMPATLLARGLGLGGGAYTLDAACASSLYAIKLACDELASGRADAMLAGGVSRPDCLYTQMGFSQLRALSRSGRCSPFDASSDGLLVGEGSGVLLLKRLDDAVAAGDRIHGVIRGIGLSNDIGGSLLAPDSEGQLRAMHDAYRRAGWSPDEVDLIECHGTGTPTGDAVEIQSLKSLWEGRPWSPGQCRIGSVKSMIGHLLTAAGAVGVIKTLLAIREKTLPPSANYRDGGAVIPLQGSPFRVQTTAEPWPARGMNQPRRAAVSAFGFGGINGHVLIEEFAATMRRTLTKPEPREPVAIVGMDARFGRVRGLAEFTEMIFAGWTAFVLRPAHRWHGADDIVRERLGQRGEWGAYIDELQIPVGKYRFPPNEISSALPQQLLMLDSVVAAMADARIPIRERRPRTGVIVGMALDLDTTNFHLRWWLEREIRHWEKAADSNLSEAARAEWLSQLREAAGPALDAPRTQGALGGMIASRIARECMFGGQSFGVSCEEGSGLRALLIAAEALQRCELDAAVVGAVDLSGDVRNVLALAERRMLTEGDAARPFDVNASGALIGEGAATVVLKRLSDAQRDGDRIYAVVRGAGAAGNYANALDRAYEHAAVPTGGVDYLELHGSGDPTEDATEVKAVQEHFAGRREPAALGSLAGSCGLAGAATGLGSLVKAALCLHHETIPPMVGFSRVDDLAGWSESTVYIPQRRQYWLRDRANGPRRAGVSSLTASGEALHVVLEGVERQPAMAQPAEPHPQIAFVFPGTGQDFPGMGRELAVEWPAIVRRLDAESQRLRSQMMARWYAPQRLDWSEGWEADAERCAAADPRRRIFGQVAFGVVMSDLLRHFGIEPSAAIGYSLGESAALFATRAWPDRDEMLRRLYDSTLFTTDLHEPYNALRRSWNLPDVRPIDWRVVVVGRTKEQVREALEGVRFARLLIVNAPKECVIGGLAGDVELVLKRLKSRGVNVAGVPTVHCDALRSVEEAYRQLHQMTTQSPEGIRIYSGALAESYAVNMESAASAITAHALHGLDFPAVIERAYADGIRIFVEVGPQSSCTRLIGRILRERPHFAISASERGESEVDTVRKLLDALAGQGIAVRRELSEQKRALPDAKAAESQSVVRVPIGRPIGKVTWPKQTIVRQAVPLLVGIGSDGPPARQRLQQAAVAASAATTRAHESFLRFTQSAMEGMGRALQVHDLLVQKATREGETISPPLTRSASFSTHTAKQPVPAFSRELCMEFARDSIARVLGPEFAEIDAHPTRVRLPDEPLMLVDRILSVEGRMKSLTSGRIVTEHDVLPGDWYLDGGRCPICITVESGQADLFLSAYLGIDFVTKGRRMYRLLDATVTFHRGLPRPGETIRYDIRIDRFVRQGETHLFFFEFDGTIDGRLVLTMRNGCAGFFTKEEIENSHGIILSTEKPAPVPAFDWPIKTREKNSYDDRALTALRAGDLAGCFGPEFAGLDLKSPLKLPNGRMKLIDRVVELDPVGGRWGLGMVLAEADVHPDDWFLTCHFVDDMVMPGTLMYECCAHALRFFLLRMGWVGSADEVCYEPIAGVESALRCRGPVTPQTKKASYQIEIKEAGYRPEPYVIAEALMFADEKRIVQMTNMSLQLTGHSRDRIELHWRAANQSRARKGAPREPGVCQVPSKSETPRTTKVYDHASILAFAVGKPSEAFGERYRIFDGERFIARLPGPPYCFIDRITPTAGRAFELEPGAEAVAEYEVPADAWYFAANRQLSMPYAVLLEIALQPCGWLAAWCGSALTSEDRLQFRNLGGTATMHEEILANSGTLRTRVKLTGVSRAGGMIIQNFDMEMSCGERVVYAGTTMFGFFTKEALSQQVGIRDAKARLYVPPQDENASAKKFSFPDVPPFTPEEVASSQSAIRKQELSLPGRAMRMIDEIDCLLPEGGPHGLGFIRGVTQVDSTAWFFKAHFYQDPVWPGSLGLESFLQLLKVFALDRWPHLAETHRFEPIAAGREHTWIYRGQIIQSNRRVEVQASITKREDGPEPVLLANGFLAVDGVIIYEMTDFGIRLVRN